MAAKTRYAAGLDAGCRVRLAICALEDDRLRFLGGAACDAAAWNKGLIADQSALTEAILAALREAEAAAGVSIESAVVGVGGPEVRGMDSRGGWDLGYQRDIGQREVDHVISNAARVDWQTGRMLLQIVPRDFVVDGRPLHRDPRGAPASHLEVNVQLISASVTEHAKLVSAVNHAHLAVEETVFEALAACYASVLPEERREGVAVLDIGAHSSGLVVYAGDALHLASAIKIGGDHFTRDLARKLCLRFGDAESIKLEYGSALAESCPPNVWLDLPAREQREPRECPRRLVCEVLEARCQDLFRCVRAELERVRMAGKLWGGVFLTGGGAKLPELCDMAERALQCDARFGLPTGIRDWPEEWNDPEWSVAAGLAMYSANLKARAEHRRAVGGLLAKILG